LLLLGVGLNLTRANNVISLDLGWSQAVESQAFDRVHRVGQMRKVHVQRVVIADTVEDRILKMQERKVIHTFVECWGALFSFAIFSKLSLMAAWAKVLERRLAVSIFHVST
jgi:SNF2 family DNA or RNA helicase